jgi:hypothetical protein
MDEVSATRSRVSVSTRLKDLIRERPKLTITLNVDRLRTLLLFLGFETLVGFCSYAYFLMNLPQKLEAPNVVEVLEIPFYAPHELVIATVVVGACFFWVIRLLLFSKAARWVISLIMAYFCLVGRNYLVASILFSTALILMALGDIKSSKD